MNIQLTLCISCRPPYLVRNLTTMVVEKLHF